MSNIKSEIDKWYENYIDELFAYGIAFGVEKDFVLDAIHDLFLHLFESADKIEILGSPKSYLFYNPQIQISAESETKRSIFREKDKTKRSKKESAQHSKSRNKSFVMTSVSAL